MPPIRDAHLFAFYKLVLVFMGVMKRCLSRTPCQTKSRTTEDTEDTKARVKFDRRPAMRADLASRRMDIRNDTSTVRLSFRISIRRVAAASGGGRTCRPRFMTRSDRRLSILLNEFRLLRSSVSSVLKVFSAFSTN